ncbi:SUKH-4 family immunity protein [Actinoallomurus sp. CA-150999]|uniref:SUKH-4 family immunity protein n=1 Tax=Actinoallomurus sp. CA-150999 TaxID=3239887 RepID=UPI003D8CCAD2
MESDDAIERALAPLRPITYQKVPVEGRWRKPPFPDHVLDGRTMAVVCEDPGIALLGVDRDGGEVLIVDADEGAQPVNRSAARLVACAEVFRKSCREAKRAEDDDEELEAIAARTLAAFAEIDPDAVRDENQVWSVAAEELGYGM